MDENIFWQVNFWGIVGTVSGLLGLLISWLNWQYSKPNIKIAELSLVITKKGRIKWYEGKSEKELANHSLKYELRIRLRNKKGGAGSIEKPILVITIPNKKLFLLRSVLVRLKPRTTHVETTRISESTSSSEVIRHGEAWNFNGGETIDDELEYWTRNTGDLFKLVSNYDNVKYSIEYHNNFGEKVTRRIKSSEIEED